MGAKPAIRCEGTMMLPRHTLVITFAALSAFTVPAALVSAQGVHDERSPAPGSRARTIEGVWRTVVTPHNCQTGQSFAPLAGLFTFHEGGTMSEYGIGPGSSPALRSPGHGVWRREHGWQDYSFTFIFYRYDAAGMFLGSQKITGTLELASSGDEFATRSIIEVLAPNGAVVGAGCATAAGTRFE